MEVVSNNKANNYIVKKKKKVAERVTPKTYLRKDS